MTQKLTIFTFTIGEICPLLLSKRTQKQDFPQNLVIGLEWVKVVNSKTDFVGLNVVFLTVCFDFKFNFNVVNYKRLAMTLQLF